MRMRKALAVPALAVVAIAGAVSLGGCDGPFMMSDDKTETTRPADDAAMKHESGNAMKDESGDSMKHESGDAMKRESEGEAEIHGSSGDRME